MLELRTAITHPERVMYPDAGITKGEVAAYYDAAAGRILPHLAGRPLTLVRCPDGLASSCFIQKHAGDDFPEAVHRVHIPSDDGAREYAMVDSLDGILSLVQRGVLEFHTWGARRDRLDAPDRVILDIDPDPDLPWDAVVQAAMDARRLLSGLGLAAFAKTTGGKGLHVVVPLARRSNWEELRAFARALADALAKQRPDLYTANPLKAQRRGRIYIDYLRNAREATAIAAYSTRARPGAPVSTPVDWDELNAAKPGTLTLRTVPSRLQAPDPWAGYERTRQSITAAMKVAVGRL